MKNKNNTITIQSAFSVGSESFWIGGQSKLTDPVQTLLSAEDDMFEVVKVWMKLRLEGILHSKVTTRIEDENI